MRNYGMHSTDGGWLFDKNFNQWTSIIVIIVLIFCDLLDPLSSDDS